MNASSCDGNDDLQMVFWVESHLWLHAVVVASMAFDGLVKVECSLAEEVFDTRLGMADG